MAEHFPETSQIEEDATRSFADAKIDSEEDFVFEIARVFHRICGEHGRSEFFSVTLPAIKQVYGTNFRKAGLRLLDIIDKGASRKPSQIGDYFKHAVSSQELQFSQKPREQILSEIVDVLNRLILDKKKEYGDAYKGVIAAIIYGSYARKNFSLNSDLDIAYIRESVETSLYVPGEKYVDYIDDFENSLGRKIRPATDNILGSVCIADEKRIEALTGPNTLIKDTFIVVSPYLDIKEKIESLLIKPGG